MLTKKQIVSSVIVVVVVAGAAFYGGLKYGQISSGRVANGGSRNFTMGSSTTRGGARGASFAGGVLGQILSLDANSLTVTAQGGGSRIVFLSASTTVNRISVGKISDLTIGANVSVIGSPNTDGSVNAQMIQLR